MRVVWAAAAAALVCAGLSSGLAACSSAGAAGGSTAGSTATTGTTGTTGSGQAAATSQDVSFTVDGTKTYGTLEIPAHRSGQHLAAALLLAGSGPTDRDGNQPANISRPRCCWPAAAPPTATGTRNRSRPRTPSGRSPTPWTGSAS